MCGIEFSQTYSPHYSRPRKFCSKRCRYRINTERAIPFKVKFFHYVKKTNNCWLWTGGCFKKTGYGAAHKGSKTISAHRLSWEIHNGEIPKSIFVCHSCDNKKCVNPSHLFLGSYLDNIADMVSKGRSLCGEKHSMAKLNNDSVIKIRNLKKNGITFKQLAKLFKINETHVKRIVYRKLWKHI